MEAVDQFSVYVATAAVVFVIIVVVTLINKFSSGELSVRCTVNSKID